MSPNMGLPVREYNGVNRTEYYFGMGSRDIFKHITLDPRNRLIKNEKKKQEEYPNGD
jgi:hypothetical protein